MNVYRKLVCGRRLSNARSRMTFAICQTSHYIYCMCLWYGRAKNWTAQTEQFYQCESERVCVCAMDTSECGVCDSMRLFVLRQFIELDMDVYEAVEIDTAGLYCTIHSIISFSIIIHRWTLIFTFYTIRIGFVFPFFLLQQNECTLANTITFDWFPFSVVCISMRICDTVSFSIHDYQSHVYYESIKNRKQTMSGAVAAFLLFFALFILVKFENAHICSSYGKEATIKNCLAIDRRVYNKYWKKFAIHERYIRDESMKVEKADIYDKYAFTANNAWQA